MENYYLSKTIHVKIRNRETQTMAIEEYVEKQKLARPLLPLCHTSDGYSFEKIIKHEMIKATECKHFESDLIYFFYGRPAYRTAKGDMAIENSFYFPVCFVINLNGIQAQPVRVAPFDTGAFAAGLMDQYRHPKMKISDFIIHNSTEKAPARIVSGFYGTNRNYLAGKPKAETAKPYDAFDFETNCYFNIISDRSKGIVDDRKRTIEIQFSENIPLNDRTLNMIVCPSEFADTALLSGFTKKYPSILINTYDTYRGNPNEFQAIIRHEVTKYINNGKPA